MKYRYWLTAFLFFLSSSLLYAQRVVVSAEVDKQRILIGEPIQLTLKGIVPSGADVEWFKVDSFPHFEIMQRSKIDSQLNGNELVLKQVLTITSWDSGSRQLPAFFMARSNRTKPIPVEVGYTPFDPKQDYHDVKDILDVAGAERTTWYWYLAGAILLLLLALLLFPGRKKKTAPAGFVPDEGIYKTSLARLEKLKQQGGTEPKLFHTELINIFRDYLHKRKNIQSHAKTTDDLGVQLNALQLPAEKYKQVLQTLRLSDLVKFARYQSTPAEQQASLEIIKESIIEIENKG